MRFMQYHPPRPILRRPRCVAAESDGAEAALAQALRLASPSTHEEVVTAVRRLVLIKDPALWDHQRNVAAYAAIIAAALYWPLEMVTQVRTAGAVHDLGKLALPPSLLCKPGPLTVAEFTHMQEHPTVGSRLLATAGMPAAIVTMVRDHHERWNGTGYPHRRTQTAISPGGRVLAVADALDAMVCDRPYAIGRPLMAALAEIERCAGQQFDPAVVAALKRVVALRGPACLLPEFVTFPLSSRG